MSTTREIDKRAQDTFSIMLPPSWLVRKQDPDIHIDYFVETTHGSDPSGLVFGVQLKGTTRPTLSKNFIKYPLKTKHLKYYLDRVKQPVFLIIIDVNKKGGYWIFIQEWAKNQLINESWRKQKIITVKIPITNSISEHAIFHAHIQEADIYMKELWPSSILSAVEKERNSLEELDPRIKVDISLHNGRPHYSLSANEKFQFDFQVKNFSENKKRFTELINLGKGMSLGMEEIIGISGSPLLENIFKKAQGGKLEIQPGIVVSPNITLTTSDSSQNQHTLFGITGKMSGGKKGIHFEGSLSKSPLKFGFFIHEEAFKFKIKANFGFDFKPWENQPILQLAYFEKIQEFFALLQETRFFVINCEIDGNEIFSGKGKLSEHICNEMAQTLEYLAVIGKIRLIGRFVGINPKFPMGGEISREDENTILLMNELVQRKEYREEGFLKKGVICLEGNAQSLDKIQQKISRTNNEQPILSEFVFEEKERSFHLLGETFEFGPLRHTITDVNLISITEVVKKKDGEISSASIKWESGVKSLRIISKL